MKIFKKILPIFLSIGFLNLHGEINSSIDLPSEQELARHHRCNQDTTVYGSFISYFPQPDVSPSTTIIYENQSVPFTNILTSRGISINASNTSFTVDESGDYFVSFSVASDLSNRFVQLFVNDQPIANTLIPSGPNQNTLSRDMISISLQKGDILSVRNVSNAQIVWNFFATPIDGPFISATLTISRVHESSQTVNNSSSS